MIFHPQEILVHVSLGLMCTNHCFQLLYKASFCKASGNSEEDGKGLILSPPGSGGPRNQAGLGGGWMGADRSPSQEKLH